MCDGVNAKQPPPDIRMIPEFSVCHILSLPGRQKCQGGRDSAGTEPECNNRRTINVDFPKQCL